jgi:hypothetical protein
MIDTARRGENTNMAKKSQDAEILLLADAMLAELRRRQATAGESYPPCLRDLAASATPTPSVDLIIKAAAKPRTDFAREALVLEKVNRKPSLDSPVCFKTEKVQIEALLLPRRLLKVFESQRAIGPDAYPLTLKQLVRLCNLPEKDKRIAKAVQHPLVTDQIVVVGISGKSPVLDSPVIHRADLTANLPSYLETILEFALAPVTTGKTKGSTAFPLSEIKKRITPQFYPALAARLEWGITQAGLPPTVSWVIAAGKPLFCLTRHVHGGKPSNEPAPADPPRNEDQPPTAPKLNFADAFRTAFNQLDQQNRGTNFVKLLPLRQALANFPREAFDLGLRELRLGREFTLNSHEGLVGTLTTEEREAAISEPGSLLVYVSRG